MAGGQLGDDAGGGGADVVDVQFGLGQTGDEGVRVADGGASLGRSRVLPGNGAARLAASADAVIG